MPYQIQDDQELFVLEEICCRGDTSQHKFKVQISSIKQAIEYFKMDENEREEKEEEIDTFLDSFDNYSITSLLASIINCYFIPDEDRSQLINELIEKGRFNVEDEECVFGVGVTKELAYQAFCEINSTNDDWDD